MTPSAASKRRAELPALLAEHGLILLYDGVCGLCDRSVQWIIRRDPTGKMRFATLQGALGREALGSLPQLADVDSVILLHAGGAWVRSTAALEICRYVGGVWSLAMVGYLIPRPIRDWAYGWIASRRYATFGRYDACPVPRSEQRTRFLDP